MSKQKHPDCIKERKKVETSKKALWLTCTLFAITLISGLVFTYLEKDLTFFMYAIPSTGGVFGATIVFYLNKAKMENVFKGKISFLEYKMELLKEQPDEIHGVINEEIDSIDNMLSQSIDSTMQEAVQENIDISNTL